MCGGVRAAQTNSRPMATATDCPLGSGGWAGPPSTSEAIWASRREAVGGRDGGFPGRRGGGTPPQGGPARGGLGPRGRGQKNRWPKSPSNRAQNHPTGDPPWSTRLPVPPTGQPIFRDQIQSFLSSILPSLLPFLVLSLAPHGSSREIPEYHKLLLQKPPRSYF